MNDRVSNWAGNRTFSATTVHYPKCAAEVQDLVRRAHRVKALGTRHSFNEIADTDGALISTAHLNRVLSLDPAAQTVTVEAGITYGALCRALREQGFALHNLASLPHISVGGACATATHGSGDRNGSLSTAVAALELVRADGECVRLRRGDFEFAGAVVHLGALGVVTSLTLDVSPTFEVAQNVYLDLPFDALRQGFDAITGSGYSVSLFTSWTGEAIDQVWVKRHMRSEHVPLEEFGATPADRNLHPLASMPAENCTPQLGAAGSWDERLPHFQMGFTPSAGEELQSEYIVPRHHAVKALSEMREMADEIAPLLYVCEIRTIAGDNLWMSPFTQRESVGIHFTWKAMWPEVSQVLPRIEERLRPFDPRPHWGKLSAMPRAEVRTSYPRLGDFRRLAEQMDPSGKFRNAFLDELLG